ncbi:hypothetical protein [Fimbriiglobus ruber]|uniref:Uncharacterized protein n=1 Tax=Fimbriiglobus ruber TaxID=1908690 RepID=A0A225DME7_9BACT|nr:hypothetical protein [Fimbriiglobus ruber]OWK40794.1 hypothetical protein FRUB_04686 [Fimbriiglobus ruber]
MNRISIVCLAVVVSGLPVWAAEPSKEAVRKLAAEVGDATVAGDYAKVIDNTYPTLVKELGGRDKALAAAEAAMKQLAAKGFAIKKYEVGEPDKFYTEGDNTFVVLPAVLHMALPVGKIRTKSYLLGISSDGGKTWKFLDGTSLQRKEFRERVLPKMPADLKLPEMSKPEIEKN